MNPSFDYTIRTSKAVDETVAEVEWLAADRGFRVLAVHDLSATLAGKGFEYPPMKIIEVCSAKHAHKVLVADPRLSLMLPCPISVYSDEGGTWLATMLPTAITQFYPDADIAEPAREVEDALKEIMHAAAGE